MAIVDVITTEPGTGPTLAQSLQSSGWQVRTHTSIDTVLGAPPSEQPRCVVVRVEPATAAAARAGDVGRLLAEQEAPVLVLQSGVGVDEAVELMRAGAAGVIARPDDVRQVVHRVRQALVHDAEAARFRLAKAQARERFAALTPRERQAMQLVVAGRPNKRIALEMNVSIKTVEVHRARVMRKMQADSLAQLVHQSILMQVNARQCHFELPE